MCKTQFLNRIPIRFKFWSWKIKSGSPPSWRQRQPKPKFLKQIVTFFPGGGRYHFMWHYNINSLPFSGKSSFCTSNIKYTSQPFDLPFVLLALKRGHAKVHDSMDYAWQLLDSCCWLHTKSQFLHLICCASEFFEHALLWIMCDSLHTTLNLLFHEK